MTVLERSWSDGLTFNKTLLAPGKNHTTLHLSAALTYSSVLEFIPKVLLLKAWCVLLWQHYSFTFQMASQCNPPSPQGFCLLCTCDLLFINRNNLINDPKSLFYRDISIIPVIPRWHLCTYLLIVSGACGYRINKAITWNHECRTVLGGCVITAISLPAALCIKLQYSRVIYPSMLTVNEAITCHVLMT